MHQGESFLSFNDLRNYHTEVLICSSLINKKYDDNKLISQARELKIKKVILINSYSNTFSLEKHLGDALLKINLIEGDKYCLEVILAYCLDELVGR